jgi:hypothetical protein
VFWRESRDHRNFKTTDRRRADRVDQYFDCTWLGDWGEESARVSSLSTSGCYIDSRSAVPQLGTALTITITLPTGEITAQGTVVSAMRGVGFAVQFTGLDDDTHARLSAY